MRTQIQDAPEFLYDIGVDFQGLDIPTAAQLYYRVKLWLNDICGGTWIVPGMIVELALTYHDLLGSTERANESVGAERDVWEKIRKNYDKLTKSVWRSIWRAIRGNPALSGFAPETVMLSVLNSVEHDEEIAKLHKYQPRRVERMETLPSFNLSEMTDFSEIGGFENYGV